MTRSLTITAPAVLALLFTALSTGFAGEARVAIDPALAAATEPLPVTGANPRRWDRPLAFGPYRTSVVRDRGTIGWSVQVLRLGVSGSKRPYAFTLETPRGLVDVECHEKGLEAWTASGFSVDLRAAAGKPALVCAFRFAGDGSGPHDTWVLALGAARTLGGGFVGELRPSDGTVGTPFAVCSLHALEGTPIPLGSPAGYALQREGRTIAAVETINAGRVWLAGATVAATGSETEPVAISAAVTALLLFQPSE